MPLFLLKISYKNEWSIGHSRILAIMSTHVDCHGPDCKFAHNLTRAHLLHHVKQKIPTRITLGQLDLLPGRNDFTADLGIDDDISADRDLLFLPNTHLDKITYIRGSPKYLVYLFGIMPCGSKTCVILENAPLIVDVAVPSGTTSNGFASVLRGMLYAKNMPFRGVDPIELYPLHGFHTIRKPHLRITLPTPKDRTACIEMLRELAKTYKERGERLDISSDDSAGDYYNKIARDYRFNTADWNVLRKYRIAEDGTTANCKYTFIVNIADFKSITKAERQEYTAVGHRFAEALVKDPTIVCQWDIENHRKIQNGVVAKPADTDYTIFMICSAYFHHHSDEPLMDVCAVDVATNAREGMGVVVECGSEEGVLQAQCYIWGRMNPDILGAYNGGNYDWPLVREQLLRNNLLMKLKEGLSCLPLTTQGRWADTNESIYRWSFKTVNVKISAETTHTIACVAQFPGVLDTDVMPVFMKLYAKAEVKKAAALNYYLAKNGLPSKEDMPYKRMFRIYERAIKMARVNACHCGDAEKHCGTCAECIRDVDTDADGHILPAVAGKCCYCGKKPQNNQDMGDVGYYCKIDCIRPQQLYVKRMIIPDKRALSNMSCVSLYDSFYRADGMKVANLIGRYCTKNEIAFSNGRMTINEADKDHYPGAWVIVPDRGPHTDAMMEVELLTAEGHRVRKTIRGRPITGLDFASLYPSLMRTFNLSPDRIIKLQADADALIAQGYTLHRIKPFEFVRGPKKETGDKMQTSGWTVRHNGIHSAKDTHIVEKYLKFETYEWKDEAGAVQTCKVEVGLLAPWGRPTDVPESARRTVSYEPVRGRKALPGERMGAFPAIVSKLFNMRVPIKREFVRLCTIIEDMNKRGVDTYTGADGRVFQKKDLEFMRDSVNAKQSAIKVLANTFYGKSGQFGSSLYELLVAAGITTAGQESIKKVASFVISKGFKVHYGDTDSLYITCADELFAECDAAYEHEMTRIRAQYADVAEIPTPAPDTPEAAFKAARVAARVVWWEEQVKITMKAMNRLREEVSDFLLADNGTTFMNMAYEEVLYPTVICGKKKYFGCEHKEEINFYPDDLFVKGIDIVKQGQAPITKKLGEECMLEAVSPENERSLLEIVEDKVRQFYQTVPDAKLFALNARYKTDKKNVAVHKFVARMNAMVAHHTNDPRLVALYEPPEAGDKFEYVIVKKEQRYTLQGKMIGLKKGDMMEYSTVYNESQSSPNPMQIDLDYYMKGQVAGVLARFIAYHPMFQPAPGLYDLTDKEQYKKMDAYCVAEAKKYIEALCDQITGRVKGAGAATGRDYRKIYKRVDVALREDLAARAGHFAANLMFELDIHEADDDIRARSTVIIQRLKAQAASAAAGQTMDINAMMARTGRSLNELRATYCGRGSKGLVRERILRCDNSEKEIVSALYEIIGHVIIIAREYEQGFIRLVEDVRKDKNAFELTPADIIAVNGLPPASIEVLKKTAELNIKLGAVARYRARMLALMQAIEVAWAAKFTRPMPEPPKPKASDFRLRADDARKMALEDARNARIIEDVFV